MSPRRAWPDPFFPPLPRTVADPHQVRLVDSRFVMENGRVEVRYGDPERPADAGAVASAAAPPTAPSR
ncbi:hypothetical protein GCM10010357_03100 [Streptomyces luteireticuli]|uniref:Uncharacterized protein n=1 Tax=Streptomyces luteireticuli TaxID=173858 RepID=A0ABN0Y7C0_9ACTN